jgi:hypothetical protein
MTTDTDLLLRNVCGAADQRLHTLGTLSTHLLGNQTIQPLSVELVAFECFRLDELKCM